MKENWKRDFWSKVTTKNLLMSNKKKLISLLETTYDKRKIENNKIRNEIH